MLINVQIVFHKHLFLGQVDSPESPKTSEMTEKFINVTKHLTKLNKRNINKLCLKKKNSNKKTVINFFSVDSRFSNVHYGKKRKTRNAGNQQKAF